MLNYALTNDNYPIVKIEFLCHNRKYTIGIRQFLDLANIPMTDAEITRTVNLILNSQQNNGS